MSEKDTIAFIRARLASVYTLELLIQLRRAPERSWQPVELVRDLRSSKTAVEEGLNRLIQAGFVTEDPPGQFCFAPVSVEHERLAVEIDEAYTSKPITVVKAIVTAPDDKIRLFSDAFKLKE